MLVFHFLMEGSDGCLLAVADESNDGGGDGHDLVDGTADGGNEQVVDQDEGGCEQDAFTQVLGIEVAHGQRVESQTHHEEQAVVALPQEYAHDRHDGGQQNGKGDIRDLVLLVEAVEEVAQDAHEVEPQSGGAAKQGVGHAGDEGGRREGDHNGAGGAHLVGQEGNEDGDDTDDLSDDFNGLHT